MNQAQVMFLQWLKQHEPVFYWYVIEKERAKSGGMAGLGFWETIVDGVKTAATTVGGAVKDYAPELLKVGGKLVGSVATDIGKQKLAAEIERIKKKFGAPPAVVSNPDYSPDVAESMRVIEQQIMRANAGQPPASTPNYQPMVTYTGSAQQQAAIKSTAISDAQKEQGRSFDINKMLPWILVGFAFLNYIK